MKLSFENKLNFPNFCLEDYQQGVRKYRNIAAQYWRKKCQKYSKETNFNFNEPPSFFIDKYSFRSWLADNSPIIYSELVDIPETDFSCLFQSYDETVRKSVVGSNILGTMPPSIDEPVRRSVFLDEQFNEWQKHLSRNGIALPSNTIDWYFSVPLREVYRNSVFYPRFPVLWGPNYFGRIADCDRKHILTTFGKKAVWDFYFFMMVCHEQSHLMQKGEPILNEIAHAILWIDFILEQDLKAFQVNSETGKTCNIEAPFILSRIEKLKNLNYGLLYTDNLAYFEQVVAESEYSNFVALAFLVHAGVLRYRYLTNLFCGLLAGDTDVCSYLRLNSAKQITVVLSALMQSDNKKTTRTLVKSNMKTYGTTEP